MPNWGGDPRVDPESTREIVYLIWTDNASGYPRVSEKCCWGEVCQEYPV